MVSIGFRFVIKKRDSRKPIRVGKKYLKYGRYKFYLRWKILKIIEKKKKKREKEEEKKRKRKEKEEKKKKERSGTRGEEEGVTEKEKSVGGKYKYS